MILAQLTAGTLNYDAVSVAAIELRNTLMPTVYFFCFLGLYETVAHSRGDGERIMMYFVWIAVTVILAVSFPSALNLLQVTVNDAMDSHNARVNNLFYQMLQVQLGDSPPFWEVANYLAYLAIKAVQAVGRVGLVIVYLIQDLSVLFLGALSPLMIGFLATSWTRSAGVRFLLVSLNTCIWGVGIAIVNMLLLAIGQHVFGAALGAGGLAAAGVVGAGTAAGLSLTTVAWPALLVGMITAALLPICLYLAVPLLTHAIMLGANPITAALSAGAGLAGAGMGMAGMAGGRAIGAGAALASRAASAAGSGSGGGGSSSAQPIAPPAPSIAPPPSSSGGGSGAPSGGGSPYASAAFDAATAAARVPTSGGASSSSSTTSTPSAGVRGFVPASGGATTSVSIPGPKPPNKPPKSA